MRFSEVIINFRELSVVWNRARLGELLFFSLIVFYPKVVDLSFETKGIVANYVFWSVDSFFGNQGASANYGFFGVSIATFCQAVFGFLFHGPNFIVTLSYQLRKTHSDSFFNPTMKLR